MPYPARRRDDSRVAYFNFDLAREIGLLPVDHPDRMNPTLEKAGRVADFFELAKLLARDALEREESCGGHFRAEHQTEDGEAKRDDDNFMHVAAWEWQGEGNDQTRHAEPLVAEYVQPSTRSYK